MKLYFYIFRQHIAPFFFGLSLIIFIFVTNLLFQMLGKLSGKDLDVLVVGEFFLLNLAWILALAVPMAVLISTLSVFGRMAGDGEITALRASGISPRQLIAPALFGALIIALWVTWYNNYLLPDLNHRTKLLTISISRKKPTFLIEPNTYNFEIPNYVLYAGEVDQTNSTLKDVTIYDKHDPLTMSVISAQNGKLDFVAEHESILMTLYNGEIHQPSSESTTGYELTVFDSSQFRMNMPGMVLRRGSEGYRGERELPVDVMLQKVRDLRKKGGPYNEKRALAYMVEIHKKFSIPVACIVFILVGAPLGMLARRGGMGVAGGLSLLFFTVYWVFLSNGEDLADRGIISPAMSMWSPNILLGLIGIWLIWYARHRTTLPGMQSISNLMAKLFPSRPS